MRIGLIGRPETHRGLGVQTQEFFRHIPCSRVLQVNFPTITGPRARDAFGGAIQVDYDNIRHGLDRSKVLEFLRGLDVVFTAETPYDWSLLDLAREMGVKTVIQGNPEFVRHGRKGFEHTPSPDRWWWPTTWRLKHLPAGEVVPVPMPDRPDVRAVAGGRLKVLHVAGKKAFADRNGTDLFYAALRHTTEPMTITVVGVEGELPIPLPQANLGVRLEPMGLDDRWEMYRDQHLLVLPRRYGGLCLPALESMACGVGVAMPRISPNTDWPIMELPMQRIDEIEMACGRIESGTAEPRLIASTLDDLARGLGRTEFWGKEGYRQTLRWSEGAPMYLQKLEEICAS